MTKKNNLTIGNRVVVLDDTQTKRPFDASDEDIKPNMIGVVVNTDKGDELDIEVEFDSGFTSWGDSRGLAPIPNNVVSMEGKLYTKTPDGDDLKLTLYTLEIASPSMSSEPKAGQRWKRVDTGDEYIVIDIEREDDDEEYGGLRFANLKTGALYKATSLFGKRGEGLFEFISADTDTAKDGEDEDAPASAVPDSDATPTEPAAGQVWKKGDNHYLVVNTEAEGSGSTTLRFMNVKSGEMYKASSLYGRRGHGQFTYAGKYAGVVSDCANFSLTSKQAASPSRGDLVYRNKNGQTKTYIVGDIENGNADSMRFFNVETGAVYSRDSLFGRKGDGKFFYIN